MKFSLKVATLVTGLSLIATAAASAQFGTIFNATTQTAVKDPSLNMISTGTTTHAVAASATGTVTAVISASAASNAIPVRMNSFYVQLMPSAMPTSTMMTVSVGTTSCPIVTGFLKMGSANNSAEVLKLQTFLKAHEKLDVDATGIFDQKTEAAVEAFQRAYMNDIMGPWGATRATGVVHLTTAKKINQLACGSALTLNGTEMSTISSYKGAADAAAMQVSATGQPTGMTVANATATNAAGPSMNGTTSTSATAHVSAWTRFKGFIKAIFTK
ncbi:MAG: hypothetical protein JWO00_15 [Candidatus Parcubacteria bacterium]|nr:hypothetical protein [Candidatus Parcubacteria bacterium]